MNQADLQALRNPIVALLVVAIAGASAIYYTDRMKKAAAQQLAQQQTLFKDARARLQRSGQEKEIIVKYVDSFRELQSDGFIGEEQRINWLDGLRLANQQADLFGVDYQIGTQASYPFAAELDPGQLSMHQSVMRLQFKLLHEGDLMRFLSALSRQGGGVFSVDQCHLKRMETRGVIRYQPNATADCELAWITARVPATGDQKKP